MGTPQHVAIIMDGNRRWASAHGLPKLMGHRHGVDAFKRTVRALSVRHIPAATFFAFSRENWRRTEEEVSWLLGLLLTFLSENVRELHEQGIRLNIIGRLEDFPQDIADAARDAMTLTKENTAMTVNVALSYGGREEIEQMVRRIAHDTKGDAAAIAAINEETINRALYTRGLPDVDLLIRTGGEQRLSGFLPWQSVYAELFFTNTLWPDFDEQELDHALADYAERKRNFGV